ncbi:MAG: alpha/beta fold hydrolase [Anaerolineaceae bacterium]|nr:alpha/beta fold hydrolase [Anaerolineaceae bacterium]
MELITFDQLSMHYEMFGKKENPAVVFLHGIGADIEMWRPQINTLQDMGYFLIVPDLRGHGTSQPPNTFRIADCVQDIYDLLSFLKIEKIHIVGVSMGGMVAQQFTLDYPRKVFSQTLVDSLSGAIKPIERFNAWLAAVILKFLSPKTQAKMIRDTYRKMHHRNVGKYFEDQIILMDSKWLLEARLEINRFNVHARLHEIHIPTLVLVGDGFGKLAINMAKATAEGISDAEFEILCGGADPSNLLVPGAFDHALINFLKKQS